MNETVKLIGKMIAVLAVTCILFAAGYYEREIEGKAKQIQDRDVKGWWSGKKAVWLKGEDGHYFVAEDFRYKTGVGLHCKLVRYAGTSSAWVATTNADGTTVLTTHGGDLGPGEEIGTPPIAISFTDPDKEPRKPSLDEAESGLACIGCSNVAWPGLRRSYETNYTDPKTKVQLQAPQGSVEEIVYLAGVFKGHGTTDDLCVSSCLNVLAGAMHRRQVLKFAQYVDKWIDISEGGAR